VCGLLDCRGLRRGALSAEDSQDVAMPHPADERTVRTGDRHRIRAMIETTEHAAEQRVRRYRFDRRTQREHTGVVAGGATAALFGTNAQINIFGRSMSLAVVTAGFSAVASLGSELVNSYVFEHIPQISAISHPMHTALGVGVQTAVICGLESQFAPGLVEAQGLPTVVGICALGVVTGSYLSREWLRPWYQQMLGADAY